MVPILRERLREPGFELPEVPAIRAGALVSMPGIVRPSPSMSALSRGFPEKFDVVRRLVGYQGVVEHQWSEPERPWHEIDHVFRFPAWRGFASADAVGRVASGVLLGASDYRPGTGATFDASAMLAGPLLTRPFVGPELEARRVFLPRR